MNQKHIIAGFIFLFAWTAVFCFPVRGAVTEYILAKAEYQIIINGKEYRDNSLPVLNYQGHTYAPMRSMLEAAGLTVNFQNGKVTVESEEVKNIWADTNIENYMTIRDMGFESSTIRPVFNIDTRSIEIRSEKGALLFIIPKENTYETEGLMLVQKSYYNSKLKPLIEKNKIAAP